MLTTELPDGIKMNAEQLIKFAAGPVRLMFTAAGCISRPIVHFCRDNGSHGVFTIPRVVDKDEMIEFAKAVLTAHQAVAYVLVNEAWMLKAAVSVEEARQLAATGIGEHPGRTEIIGLSAEDQEGAAVQAYMPVTRNILTPKPALGELVIMPTIEGETVEGRFLGLLPKRQGQRLQ